MSGRIDRRRAGIALIVQLFLLAGCAGTPSAPLVGAGSVRTEARPAGAFTHVEVRHGIRLEFALGSPPSVTLTAQDNLLPITTTTLSGGRLTVDANRNYISPDGILVTVTTPTLEELVLVGGAIARGEAVDVQRLGVRTEGGAIVHLGGSADRLVVRSNGGGVVDFGSFVARDAEVTLEGGVLATLNVTDSAHGTATGGVIVTLHGGTRHVDIVTSGGAMVLRR